ncbi:MAG: HAD-IC family P-type ATPase, partial [Clostridia bacterium]|nr:HAD-IC family P-type ATPase [Clostridia bacterium]
HTVVLVGGERGVEGLVALRDRLRPEAREAVADLRRLGIRHLVLLTGDHRRTAEALARELGVDEVHAGLRPEQKADIVADLVRSRGGVVMVGDGLNDAPALAAATVGIAMGAAGADAAIEAADVALMADDLRQVAFALRLGRRARAISLQNIAFSLAVLVVLVPVALLGGLDVAAAVVTHEVSELLAVANGLRARAVTS